jgi:hypothetical protein
VVLRDVISHSDWALCPQIAYHKYNIHYFVVDRVIDMASHSRLALNKFDMIKHHPRILQITLRLHLSH